MIDVWAIQSELRKQTETVTQIPTDNEGNQRIAWQGVEYEPEEGQAWVRETFFTPEERMSANNEVTGRGLYVLDLFVPKFSRTKDARAIIDGIKAKFKPTTVLGGIVRIERATGQTDNPTGPWHQYPIEIRYITFSTNE